MADAPKAAPAAAAKPAGGGGGGKAAAKGGKKKNDDPTSQVVFQQIKYGHGAKQRKDRQEVRIEERASRLATLKEAASKPDSPLSPLSPALARVTGQVIRDDPILAALARDAQEAEGLPAPAVSAYGKERLASLEEIDDLVNHAATERALAMLGDDLPEAMRPAFRAVQAEDANAINTDVDTDDEAEKEFSSTFTQIVRSQGRAVPMLPGLPSAEAERQAHLAEMTADLLQGTDLKAKMLETTRALAGDAGDIEGTAYEAMSALRDPETGSPLAPEAILGFAPHQSYLLTQAVNKFEAGDVRGPGRKYAGNELEDHMDEDNPEEPEYGMRLAGVWGDDPTSVPQGLLHDMASGHYFMKGRQGKPMEAISTLRETIMVPGERGINDRRKQLRELIEKPQPITYRPLWPLYSMIAGVDQVQQVTAGGMVASARCMVVVGNGMGGIGVGMKKHADSEACVKKALEKAIRDMVHINTNNGALYHDCIGKKNNVYVIMRTIPKTVEIFKAAPLVSDILELAGITHYSAKIVGSHKGRRNPYIVTQAVFDAFNHHYPPEREAYARGLRPIWATADRVSRHTVFPQNAKGPRFPAANSRIQDTGRARAQH